MGATPDCAWGSYQGSAPRPYEVVVDRRPPERSTCSCPSRKFPCRHAIALLERLGEETVPEEPPPAYAEAWLARRRARATGALDSRALLGTFVGTKLCPRGDNGKRPGTMVGRKPRDGKGLRDRGEQRETWCVLRPRQARYRAALRPAIVPQQDSCSLRPLKRAV